MLATGSLFLMVTSAVLMVHVVRKAVIAELSDPTGDIRMPRSMTWLVTAFMAGFIGIVIAAF